VTQLTRHDYGSGVFAEVRLDDIVHTGPATLAGRYMRSFWQPVFLSRQLKDGHAVPVRVMNEDFTLYRGETGTPHVVAFRCAHRGTQLSTGWVEGDCIRCFYHGWKYDGSGQCVEQPAEDADFAAKVRIRSYPTEEYLGLIFAYLGEGDAPPLPRYPEFEQPGVVNVTTYGRACNFFNNVENALDPVHTAFVHRTGVFTDNGLINLPQISGEESAWGITMHGLRPNGIVRVNQFGMPNVLHIKIVSEFPDAGWLDALAWRVPIDDEQHGSFNVNLSHVSGEPAERYRRYLAEREAAPATDDELAAISEAVMNGETHVDDFKGRPDLVGIQDYVAQVGQGAIADRDGERLGRSDVMLILLRKIWLRELRALADGRPLKTWTKPPELTATARV